MSKLGGDRHLESCMFVPKEKNRSVDLKSSLPDRLLTNNVEHTYM